MKRLAILATLLASAWSPMAAKATATLLTDSELADQRGGIQTPTGFDIGFGASVRTYVDGQLILQTQLTWTGQGVQTQRTGIAGDTLAPDGSFSATVPGLTGGATQVMQNLSNGQITSVVLNTASNRTILQDTDVTLVVPQLADLQRQVMGDRLAQSLQSAVGLALRNRSGP